ncbi:uncharacterized protein B0H64DRAFT_393133 [Chaetomium fimeti]|uniref:Uncharacterized protein n=1 Tax=Chaetomium fimeti TaxID=1854472 RepID=A0AAE0LUC0_9PEZI|nr:hypothetical protein B0H64DRAFT_393133 [Chaetomium fimeti]
MSTPTPPLVLPARGPARGSPAPGSVSPPPGYSGGDGKGSQPGLLGPRGRDHLAPPAGPETGSPYRHEHGRLVGYSPAEQTSDGARGGPRRQQDPRESWGSWSGAGTVVGSGSYHASSVNNVNVTAESATPAGEREGISSGTRGQHVSPRTSVSSDVTATADTMVTAVSRMSSARDDK